MEELRYIIRNYTCGHQETQSMKRLSCDKKTVTVVNKPAMRELISTKKSTTDWGSPMQKRRKVAQRCLSCTVNSYLEVI